MWLFAFRTTGLTYLFLLLAEYLRPGFVSMVFQVHWVLLLLFVLFGMLLFTPQETEKMTRFEGLVFACFVAVLLWGMREDFGGMTFLLILGAFALPLLMRRRLNQQAE
jgi:hypothetical protein